MGNQAVCLFYHRVGRAAEEYSISPELFQEHLEILRNKGYRAITISGLVDFLAGKKLEVEKPILLAFDDGHLDLFVHAFPLLLKYKMRAVVFLVTGWMNEADPGRPARAPAGLENCSHDESIRAALRGDRRLFLSWSMAQEMAQSGLVEFGSHSASHRIAFRSDRVKRFIFENFDYWRYQQVYGGEVRPGLPVFQWASDLAVRRFQPEEAKLNSLLEFCSTRECASAGSRDRLSDELGQLAEKLSPLGNYEPEREARKRILEEMKSSKQEIEDRLGAACSSLCWPFGHYSGLAMELAQAAGYKIAFTTERGAIGPGDNPFALKRLRAENMEAMRLARGLSILGMPLLDRLLMGKARSRKIVQTCPA